MKHRPNAVLTAVLGVVAAACLGSSPASAAATEIGAAAAPPPVMVEVPLGDPVRWSSDEYAAPDLPQFLGTLRIQLGEVPQVPTVRCVLDDLVDGGSYDTTVAWTPALTVDLEIGFLDPTHWFRTTCSGSDAAARNEFRYEWSSNGGTDAGEIVTYDRGVLLEHRDGRRFGQLSPDDRVSLSAGDVVRLVGAPGSFCPVGWDGLLFAWWGDPDNNIFAFEATASSDGSALEFRIGTDAELDSPEFFGGYSRLDLFPRSGCAGSDSYSHLVSIRPGPRSTAVKAAVSLPIASSVQQVKAITLVTDPADATPAGRIQVSVDGKPVKSTTLRDANAGRWIFSLPPLPRGTHTVVSRYYPPGAGIALVSPPVSVRILF